jgi:ketosteroid isomerase-like protein
MQRESNGSSRMRVPGVVILAFLLVGFIWAGFYFGAEARVRRATARVVGLAEKQGEESPVSLGLSVNRLGKYLAADAVLELEDYGSLAEGRQEITSLFAQIRSSLKQIEFTQPEISVATVGKCVVEARVAARYRLAPDAGDAAEGNGTAELIWTKGDDGWQIVRATLHTDEAAKLPGGWK